MTVELDNVAENHEAEILDNGARKSLVIFKTDIDRYGRDITAMSDFFDGYVQQMSLALREQSSLEIVSDLPVANLGIINDIIHQADVIMRGNITLLPDFDNLPTDIKSKLKKGIYKVGDSKQVDGNLRAVILDENDVRVKDITLKKVINYPGNIETARSIGNQLQMRQIYAKLADIQEFQAYQLEKDRDRDIIVPFFDARSLVLEAENKESEEERVLLLKEADGKIRTALNAIYADVETTSKSFARRTSIPFLQFGNQLNCYMGYLTSDFQIATKYVGVRMQLLEYMGDVKTAKLVLQQYQHVMYDFLTKPVTRKRLSIVTLMHDYFPYDKTNMNCWHTFSKEMQPALESGIKALELSMNGTYNNDVYIVSVEDINDEKKE
ncbi:hypothetical protein G9F73_010365 [Clostridium estertheticum]|uniref:hypothetical protein n=1 Tax=Clostridium estertheticum TaxID=238834 RepID=UPI001CC98184|nr:hypothetical protein [Clostridium estertheticum]MBZ9608208.1 hypothetical protein [Clostridium estertheticum]